MPILTGDEERQPNGWEQDWWPAAPVPGQEEDGHGRGDAGTDGGQHDAAAGDHLHPRLGGVFRLSRRARLDRAHFDRTYLVLFAAAVVAVLAVEWLVGR